MNEAFYATRPWEYFRHRERGLIAAAGAPERFVALLRDEIQVGKLKFRLEDSDATTAEDEAENLDRYVIAESQVLLHHASETLLRLYLAHENLPPCPWLEVARVRSPGKFKRQVEDRFITADEAEHARNMRSLARVFFGNEDPDALTPRPSDSDWAAATENVEAFLRHYAAYFLDADIYNALKHGLAVRPGEASMQLDDGKLIRADGPSIEYLSIRDGKDGQKRWNQTTRWIEVDRSLSLLYLATMLMESLWDIARGRYLNDTPDHINLWLKPKYVDVAVDPFTADEPARVVVDTVHSELTYYVEPEAVVSPHPLE